jgi:hypothetical protein
MSCCGRTRISGAVVARRLANGASGLAKAALHLQTPPGSVVAGRALQCFGSSGQVPPCERLGVGLVCLECGCLAMAKIRVASQECPLGKWGAVLPGPAATVASGREPSAMVRPPNM